MGMSCTRESGRVALLSGEELAFACGAWILSDGETSVGKRFGGVLEPETFTGGP